MPPRNDLGRVKAGWRADAEGGIADPEMHAGELLAGQRWRRARTWLSKGLELWTGRLERLGRWLKAIVTVIGAAGFIWRAVVYYKTRRIAPPEQPATGVASTAVDRVDKPLPPK